MTNVCVCHTCVDPREHGFFDQHGLPVYNGVYMTRVRGAFAPNPNANHDASNTGIMLLQMGRTPLYVVQGHRDCAAVGVLAAAYDKPSSGLTDVDRQFLSSHRRSVEIVKKCAAALPSQDQLRILEKICVLQDINNLFAFISSQWHEDYTPHAYAYFSLTRPMSEPQPEKGSDVGLMIFDPEEGVFVGAKDGNHGIRIADLIDVRTSTSRHNRFGIRSQIDLEAAARNEARFALDGIVPGAMESREQIRNSAAVK